MPRIKKTNKTKKRATSLIPLSGEEIRTRIEENRQQLNLPVLDALGNKLPAYEASRRVTILEDHSLKLPELWLTVYVHGPEAGVNFTRMFARSKCFKADTPDDADLVVFTGSSHDVDPQLYGERQHNSTVINIAVDRDNITLFGFCKRRGIPMMGVCGGAQIGHVLMGGKLYQDVDGHNAPHTMWTTKDRMLIEKVSSVHHQMCIKNDEMEILGLSHAANERWLNDKECVVNKSMDVEAFFYRETCFLGFQGHPEYSGYNKYTQWCLQQIDHHMNENPDLSYRHNDQGSNKLRIKQELLDKYEKANPITVTFPSEEMLIVEKVKG
jgi:gamma-glutamyl-gamma-aminobutyrate hydrolase PuuD